MLAVIIGIVAGSVLNGLIVSIGPRIIPPPAGADVTTIEGLKASIHLFQPINFIAPFLAHALGTLIGSFLTYKIAATRKTYLAYFIGVLFFVGGLTNVFMLPAPAWFNVIDLAAAYLPMSYIAIKIGYVNKEYK